MSLQRNDLPALAVKRPVLVAVLNLLIIIGGLAALFGVEVRELPDVDRPVVMVRAFFDGASPETMDAEVTSVIEGAVARVSGVTTINSASEENNARVRAEFGPGVDLDIAANDVREAVAEGELLPVGRRGRRGRRPHRDGRRRAELCRRVGGARRQRGRSRDVRLEEVVDSL